MTSALRKHKSSVTPGASTASAPPAGAHPIDHSACSGPSKSPPAIDRHKKGLPTDRVETMESRHPTERNLSAWARDVAANPDASAPLPPDKRRRVTVEEVPDVQAPRNCRWKGFYVEEFPESLAGSPISDDLAPPPKLAEYMRACGPMGNPDYFEIAELLLTSGLSDVDKDRHLKSKMYAGKAPWKNVDALLASVDKLVHGPEFDIYDIDLHDGRRPRLQFMVCRDIIKVLRDFFANPAFKDHMRYKPRRLYTSPSKTERVYADMADADWWWREMEKLIERGYRNGTIAPVIIATDQTTLSVMCGGQKAYPVYVSFGNLDKEWRRKPSKHGTYLLGYLPVDAFEDIPDDKERRRLKADLVHRAMEKMLEPLREASEQGVEVWCPDGRLRRVYPRVAAYTADWPEQNLQCCTSEGGCPVCKTSHADRGNLGDEAELREREETLNALRTYICTQNEAHLDDLKLKPVWPWWGDIPDVNLSACIAPDLLHQAYQGVFKTHLVRWMKKLLGVDVLDNRFASMPQAAGLTHFAKGLSAASGNRWTGHQSKQLLAQFMPTVVCGLTAEKSQLVRSLIDFMYRAHATSLTESDLADMDDDLRIFHQQKELLVGPIYESDDHFNKIAKLHMLRHWTHSIRELGTPDGYNTEGPEHLHIEYAKVPWRASNKVRPLPQMVKFIQRQEAIRIHRAYLDQYLADDLDEDEGILEDADDVEDALDDTQVVGGVGDEGDVQSSVDPEPVYYPNPTRHMATTPTVKGITIQEVVNRYHASNMIPAITDFLIRRLGLSHGTAKLLSPQNYVGLWHKLSLRHPPPSFAPFDPIRRDVVRASPPTRGNPATWDVALYLERPNRVGAERDLHEKHGIERYRAGRVRAFFHLPAHIRYLYPGPLAYLELFTPFSAPISPFNKLNSTTLDFEPAGPRRTLVIPVSDIVLACHLIPKYHLLDKELQLHSGMDMLSISRQFWLNHYYNHHLYRLIQHWRHRRLKLQQRLLQNLQHDQPPGPLPPSGRSTSSHHSLPSPSQTCLSERTGMATVSNLPPHLAHPPYPQLSMTFPGPAHASPVPPDPALDPKLWYGIGILYDRYGSLEHAEEAFSSALRMDKDFDKTDEIFFRLGIIYKQRQKYEEALKCFERIHRNPPAPLTNIDIWFQIGQMYEQMKYYTAANDAYERILKDSPNHAKVLQ
ncbi:hypothetical protein FRC11_012268 [Ceratobasidium sp. 423]|nr:hypothetical protein FRC11_012268 [Ceratobasidium sp. 423]